MNSTAITANDTAVRLSSLWNLNCSLVAGGADDPLHLVRAPNAQSGYELPHRARRIRRKRFESAGRKATIAVSAWLGPIESADLHLKLVDLHRQIYQSLLHFDLRCIQFILELLNAPPEIADRSQSVVVHYRPHRCVATPMVGDAGPGVMPGLVLFILSGRRRD